MPVRAGVRIETLPSHGGDITSSSTTGPAAGAIDDDANEDNSGPRKINMPEPEPVDLLDTAGAPLFKRFGPFALVALVLVLLRRRKR